VNRDGTVIYRSGMNPKIHRNFQIFTPCDFIAAITQHIPDKSFQLVRYYGWYSNKMRGIPSKKWRDLIKKVWEADPMICPTCQREMRIVPLIDEREVIEKMLKCLGFWEQGVRVEPNHHSGTDPPNGDWVYEPIDQDPFPDYDTEPVLFYANA
jgi:hypothetical protein